MSTRLLREASEKDVLVLEGIASAMKTRHEPCYFLKCLTEGKRTVALGLEEGRAAGYVMLNWQPSYHPFLRLGIPEIQDLNVIPEMRGLGLGGTLVQWCEDRAREAGCAEIGISVGLDARYGAAQRLYAHRGYIPDGAGACHDDIPVAPGEVRPVDDLLTLKMLKKLI